MRLSFLVESPILYLAFFKTILAALFRAFGLPLSFLPSKPSFLHDHSTTQYSDVSSLLAISTTDKKYIGLCSHAAERFCVKGVYFSWYSQKTRKEFEWFGLWNTKNVWLENILAHMHLWCASMKTSMKIVNYIERHNFCWNDLLTKSNRSEIQTYKVGERTFGTPCISSPAKCCKKIAELCTLG